LTALFRGFFDALLRLFFGAHENDFPAFAHRLGQKFAGRFKLREGFREVNDMNAVASIEDEGLHLGVPTFRLVPEMDARVQ